MEDMLASVSSFWSGLVCRRGRLCPNLADSGIDNRVQQLSVVGMGLRLDVLPGAFAGLGAIWQREPTLVG